MMPKAWIPRSIEVKKRQTQFCTPLCFCVCKISKWKWKRMKLLRGYKRLYESCHLWFHTFYSLVVGFTSMQHSNFLYVVYTVRLLYMHIHVVSCFYSIQTSIFSYSIHSYNLQKGCWSVIIGWKKNIMHTNLPNRHTR